MFIGHYGIALAAKRAAPKASLGLLLPAAQFLDVLWPIFLLAGLEQVKIAQRITRATPLDFVFYPYRTAFWPPAFGGLLWTEFIFFFAARKPSPECSRSLGHLRSAGTECKSSRFRKFFDLAHHRVGVVGRSSSRGETRTLNSSERGVRGEIKQLFPAPRKVIHNRFSFGALYSEKSSPKECSNVR